MPEISVIVPVYKVEEYLSVCVQSILDQTFVNFELILVDDGSPDRCGEICEEFACKDDRVRVIHQENRGLSGARNAGMEIARGNYVTFVDSDDIVADIFLEELYTAIKKENADMAVCVSCDLSEKEIQNYEHYISKEEPQRMVTDKKTAIVGLYDGNIPSSIGATCKLYTFKLISELRFPLGRLHEDQSFTPQAFYSSEKIVFTDAKLYFYRIREESITHKTFRVKRYDDLWAIDSCIAFFQEKGEQEIVEAALRKRMRLLCVYSIYARRDKVEVPEEYRVSVLKAIRYLRKNVSPEKYQYYLAQIHPKLGLWFEYSRKIRKVLNF